MFSRTLRVAVAGAVLATASPALAHPSHQNGADPDGTDAPPPVKGISPTAKKAPAPPPPVTELSDEDLMKLAEREAEAGETIEVEGDAPAESASSIHLDAEKLARRSRTQMSDILRQVPGLMVSQHAGGGKADQYFIRGFDADHGTDIAIYADGIPVNLTSHGHGQGYADSHWMIPELVGTVDVHKGPYAARYGDFYTAGALELTTLDELPNTGTVYISGGSPVTTRASIDKRMVAIASPAMRDGDKTIIAAEIGEQDGPFINQQNFQRGIVMGKWQGKVGRGTLKLETNWYTAKWNQSGQVPSELVSSGALDRFGAIDPSEGGTASRTSVQAKYEVAAGEGGTVRVAAYGVRNKLDLFSNFTLYARDLENGDGIEQTDDRYLYGGSATYQKAIHRDSFDALVTSGLQLRIDDVGMSLWHAAQRRRVDGCFDGMNPCNQHDSQIVNAAAFVEANVIPSKWLHVFPGMRVDGFAWDVSDDKMPGIGNQTAARALASPKLSVELHPSEQLNFFVNSGAGFHSNDARAAVATNGAGALARAWGGEVGARVKPNDGSRVSMDVWYLQLSSEQVWSGDNGGTEASDKTRRFGLDIEGSTKLTKWLALDGNVTWAKSRFVANAGNAGAIALAPRWMGSAGVTANKGDSFVSLRGRGISDRAGNEDGTLTAEGYMIFDVVAGTRVGSWGLNLTVNNLLDGKWREAQFAEESRVSPTAELAEQMHFTPGIPLTATATASYSY